LWCFAAELGWDCRNLQEWYKFAGLNNNQNCLSQNATVLLNEFVRSVLRPAIVRWGKENKRTQEALATECGTDGAGLSHFLAGNGRLQPDVLFKLCEALSLDSTALLLLSEAQRCEQKASNCADAEKDGWLGASGKFIETHKRNAPTSANTRFKFGLLTLADWPWGFDEPIIVLVGDRRENPPHTIADLLASSGSPGDLFYFSSLKLSDKTLIRSDKVTKLGTKEFFEDLGEHHLLIIGSPAVNLAARAVNSHACFSFIVSKDAIDSESAFEQVLKKEAWDPDVLENYLDVESKNLEIGKWARKRRHMINDFARSGIMDPVNYAGPRGLHPGANDFGVVTLCKHPWSNSKVAILAAGIRGPGTAASLKMLAEPNAFEDRPLGGVFRVRVPNEAPWASRYTMLKPKWDTHSYSVQAYENSVKGLAADAGGEWSRKEVLGLLEILKRTHSAQH
jgi:transcriptional regulator with XRE-family HTH domain